MTKPPDQIEEMFAPTAADPQAWLELARALRIAAQPILHRLFEILEVPQRREGIRLEKLACVKAYMFLTGLAFENVLKAIAFARGFTLADLRRHRSGHGLTAIADRLDLQLAPAEREYLRRLEEYVLWAGRYPVSIKVSDYVSSYRDRRLTFRAADPALSDQLFNRLLEHVTQSA